MTKWKTVLAFSSIFLTILFSPTSAQAPGETVSGEMPIAGDISLSISSVPADIDDFPLIPGQDNTDGGNIEIIAVGTGWSLSVSDDDTTTGGKMTEYDTTTSEYVTNPDQLQAYMGVTATGDYGTGSCVTLDKGGAIAHDHDLLSGGVIPITFNQTVSWSDPVSAPNCVYRIVVTYTIEAA